MPTIKSDRVTDANLVVNVKAEGPRHRRWIVIGSPTAILSLIVGLEIRAYERLGLESDTVVLWLILGLIVVVLYLPAFSTPRSVAADRAGMTVEYYVGTKRRILWETIESVQIEIPDRHKPTIRGLQVVPKKGRRVRLDEEMSNFEQFLGFVQELARNESFSMRSGSG